MRYMLLFHYVEATEEDLGTEAMAAGRKAFASYAATLEQAGILVSGQVLQPSSASTTITMADGEPRIQDGPFADTKEQLAGTFVIEVPDLDAALAWAEQCPGAHYGVVEIRPSAIVFKDGAWRPQT